MNIRLHTTIMLMLSNFASLTCRDCLADADDDKQLLALFESKCSSCHEDEEPYLHKGIDLAELRSDDDYVVAGRPDQSELLRRISLPATSKKRMPKSTGNAGDPQFVEPLADSEIAIVRSWILGDARSERDEGDVPAPPAHSAGNPTARLANRALQIFENRCAECHRDAEAPRLDGNISLSDLVAKVEYITPGKPEDSLLFKLVDLPVDDKRRMPRSRGEEEGKNYTAPLTSEEKAVIKELILSADPGTGNRPEKERDYITAVDIVREIALDLSTMSKGDARFQRYLTISNLYNIKKPNGGPAEDASQMNAYRAGMTKLVNSISTGPEIVVPEAIDQAKTIYRIDLRDYKISHQLWERFADGYPYGLGGAHSRSERTIRRLSGSRIAFLRADWFVFAAAQPPLYHDLLQIPVNDRMLLRDLGVDLIHNLATGNAMRAGFRVSGVSTGPRLIERHLLGVRAGYFWVSYDFALQNADPTRDLFVAPFGPPNAGLTDDPDLVFQHAGGEIIYSLPNGMQGYMLSDAEGNRLGQAPINIVQDANHPAKVIINGISCMSCHIDGMKHKPPAPRRTGEVPLDLFSDEVGPAIRDNLGSKDKRNLDRLYAAPQKFQAAVARDAASFQMANEACLTPFDYAGGDPIRRLYFRFLRNVSLAQLVAEVGEEITAQELLAGLAGSESAVLRGIAGQLKTGLAYPRQFFEPEFQKIAEGLDFETLPFKPIPYEEFGGVADEVEAAAANTAFSHDGLLRLTTDKRVYTVRENSRVSDVIEVEMEAKRDMFIRLFHQDVEGKITQIFPNDAQRNNFIRANKKIAIPPPNADFRFRVTEPLGIEVLLAVGSPLQFTDLLDRPINAGMDDFTALGSLKNAGTKGFKKRGVKVEIDGRERPAPLTKAQIAVEILR